MSTGICCEICGKSSVIKLTWGTTIDNKMICGGCENNLGKGFVKHLQHNGVYSKESYIATLNYKNQNNQMYGNIFNATNSYKKIELDFNNALMRIEGNILPIADITKCDIPTNEIKYEGIKYAHKEGECEAHLFKGKIWIKDFGQPYVYEYTEYASRWIYNKGGVEMVSNSYELRDLKRAISTALNAMKNPYIISGLKDMVVKNEPPNFQEALYVFGYSDIYEVSRNDLYSRYRKLISLMAETGQIDEYIADRINMLYMFVGSKLVV